MAEWWNTKSRIEKTIIVAAGAVITAATAKAIIDGGLVVITGKTVVACGKAATIIACKISLT